jgi:hypothetical protein
MLDSTACTESIALCSPAGVLPQSRWVIRNLQLATATEPIEKLRDALTVSTPQLCKEQ